MTTSHNNTLIEYNERENTWDFTLRGKGRRVASLAEAKLIIDKPVSEKAKAFEPIVGWLIDYNGSESSPGRVTSFQPDRFGTKKVRFVETNDAGTAKTGGATNENFRDFFPKTEHNDTIVGELRALTKEIERLSNLRTRRRAQLVGLNASVADSIE